MSISQASLQFNLFFGYLTESFGWDRTYMVFLAPLLKIAIDVGCRYF
jgi:hypothetical protein